MERPLVYIAIAFALGIVLAKFIILPLWLILSCFLIFIFIAVYCLFVRLDISGFILILFFLSGAILLQIKGVPRSNDVSLLADKGYLTLVGCVDNEPREKNDRIYFACRVEEVYKAKRSGSADGTIYVSIPNAGPQLGYGERVKVRGVISEMQSYDNPLMPGSEKRYILRANYCERLPGSGGNPLKKIALIFSKSFNEVLLKILPNKEASLLGSILLGSTVSPLPDETKADYRKAGLIHLLVVSGTQVSILIGVCLSIFRSAGLPLWTGVLFTSFFNLMLVVVTGGGPSIIRAAIMGEITLLGLLFERQKEFYTALAASALLLLIFDPQSLFDIGFQLSFTATWSLVYIAPVLEKKLPKILAISIAPIIATAPIIAFYFSQVTIGAVVSNLLVLPWVEFLVVLGFSATMVGFVLLPLAQILGGTIWLMLAFLDAVAQMVAALPGACFYLKAPAIPLIAGYYLGLIALIEVLRSDEKPVFTPRRIAVVFLLIFSVFVWNYVVSAEPLGDNGLTVTFLDVGQGDAILVETPERMNILIDGGGTDQGEGDQAKKDFVGQKVVVPFLRRKGINRLDLMVLTHPHADHMGGLIPVLKEIKIDQVLDSGQTYDSQAYRRFKALIAANKIKYSVARSGQNIRFGRDLSGSILNPVVPYLGNANSDSIVMRLVYKDISFLFTGDLEREGEERLLGQRLRSTILKVGHHGSSTSTSDQFLRAVSPKVAVISVGAHNRYRHPFPGTIMKLERSGIRLYRTDEDGAVVIKTDGDQFSVEPQRRSRSPRTHSLSSGWQGRGKALRWPRPG